jgi:hypothetical protein
MKFSTKLTVFFTAMAGSIVFVFLTIIYFQSARTLEREVCLHMETYAFYIMNSLDHLLSSSSNEIKLMAGDLVFKAENATAEEITERLLFYRNTCNRYVSLSFFDLNRIRIADTAGLSIGTQDKMTPVFEEVLNKGVSVASDIRVKS